MFIPPVTIHTRLPSARPSIAAYRSSCLIELAAPGQQMTCRSTAMVGSTRMEMRISFLAFWHILSTTPKFALRLGSTLGNSDYFIRQITAPLASLRVRFGPRLKKLKINIEATDRPDNFTQG